MASDIYHEKQVKELCALHALNNLFQNPTAFTKPQLDSICYSLSPDHFVNPHKSMLGLGNYDVNVIMAALQMKDCEAIWFDKRKDPSCLSLSNIQGFILNIPSEYRLGFLQLPIRRKHWIAIREIGDVYYNLDSKLENPELIGKESDLLSFLREQIQSKDREIFVVVEKEIEQSEKWRKRSFSGVHSADSNCDRNGFTEISVDDTTETSESPDSGTSVSEESESSSSANTVQPSASPMTKRV